MSLLAYVVSYDWWRSGGGSMWGQFSINHNLSHGWVVIFVMPLYVAQDLFYKFSDKSCATKGGTKKATTRPCGELWLVEGCPTTTPHQPQLAIWTSCSFFCDSLCGTKRILNFLYRITRVIQWSLPC